MKGFITSFFHDAFRDTTPRPSPTEPDTSARRL